MNIFRKAVQVAANIAARFARPTKKQMANVTARANTTSTPNLQNFPIKRTTGTTFREQTPKRTKTRKEIAREKLRATLRRIDGGGKHYGSKRAESNHRGTGHGKRSGRA